MSPIQITEVIHFSGQAETMPSHESTDRRFMPVAVPQPAQAALTFDAVWDAIDWDNWRMQPIRELVRHIHTLTMPSGEANAPAQAEALPAEKLAIELQGIQECMSEGSGFWHSCSGCHETEDGHSVGQYPYSQVFKCELGSGCAECGGIGAVWNNTDYEALHNELFPDFRTPTEATQANAGDKRDAWCIVCGDWKDEHVALHGENGHIASGLTLEQAKAIIEAYSGAIAIKASSKA